MLAREGRIGQRVHNIVACCQVQLISADIVAEERQTDELEIFCDRIVKCATGEIRKGERQKSAEKEKDIGSAHFWRILAYFQRQRLMMERSYSRNNSIRESAGKKPLAAQQSLGINVLGDCK